MSSSKSGRSTRRPLTTKAHSSSSEQPQPSTWPPPPSFLFAVNDLTTNEDVENGGVMPQINLDNHWLPPVQRAGFNPQRLGTLYRWSNGAVSVATDCSWVNNAWQDSAGNLLNLYKAATMFYANAFDMFRVANGDVTYGVDMVDADFPGNRWYPITFHLDPVREGLSRVDISAESDYIAGASGTGTHFTRQLGLSPYRSRAEGAPLATGLAGNLALVVGLIAFSCSFGRLHNILTENRGAWRGSRWRGHGHNNGRNPERGMVVTIYYDSTNPQGSTPQTLWELEYGGEAIL